jgi:CxxC motif-containing protein (DUF1111 family)
MRKLATTAAALVLGTVVLVAGAQDNSGRAPYWPKLLPGPPVLDEWYSDIPWHQKLGTYAGNQIDEPLVLPFEALPQPDRDNYCKGKLSDEDCMIELGINNILGMHRIDTLYDPMDDRIKNADECKNASQVAGSSPACIEVMLKLSSFWTRGSNSGIALQARPFGDEGEPADGMGITNYLGYVITEGSTYAPQMPWYTSHYCDSQFTQTSDVQDPVCYGDYLSPMNSGFNQLPASDLDKWPRSVPWSAWPTGLNPNTDPKPPVNPPSNHCQNLLTECQLVLGGFDLKEVQATNLDNLQYSNFNKNLFAWFNNALNAFATDFSQADRQRHFPWNGAGVSWETFMQPQALQNPFLGVFDNTKTQSHPGCTVSLTGSTPTNCTPTDWYEATNWVYPRQCTLGDLAAGDAAKLRKCGLNYELHHNGYQQQWPPSYWTSDIYPLMFTNQYGRTSFLFAGVPGMQQPVPFYKDPNNDSGLSVYEQVYNASIFSLYIPIANEADQKRAFSDRQYKDTEFYHTLLMSNHMEADPPLFAEGVRGKVLWHDEYRSQLMYEKFRNGSSNFPTRVFAAAFSADTAPAPFHNNTCDGCHVRNGSGVPTNTLGTLDPVLQEFMQSGVYNPFGGPTKNIKDYTFTGQIRPMKLVFFDLQRSLARPEVSVYAEPLAFAASVIDHPPRTMQAGDLYYHNAVMNFYGDSFHVTRPTEYNYTWHYEPVNPNRLVVTTKRQNSELNKMYMPQQIKLGTFTTSSACKIVQPPPKGVPWPGKCDDINDAAIHSAMDTGAIGFMLLNGKRLGNLSAIEAIPNQTIIDTQASQAKQGVLGPTIAGQIAWSSGSRDGVNGKVQKDCKSNSLRDCFIGRFGWVGDRVSIEDQVANAAFVEMNMLTTQGYNQLYSGEKVAFPIRYAFPNCGPANQTCIDAVNGNADLLEVDVNRMADYARWLGNPTRSEFQVTLPDVIAGEKVFRQVKCDTCHVIKRINIDPEQTMLTQPYRDRLKTRIAGSASPFVSYIGTDLLMHDMGYLSQLADAGQSIRGTDGVVLSKYQTYVQKIRTPPLKGLRFNRFVTDSHRNLKDPNKVPPDPACDFLLHDGRACDAIEAAFLHDGPAIKKLGVIDGLNGLSPNQLLQLRAFLYSL